MNIIIIMYTIKQYTITSVKAHANLVYTLLARELQLDRIITIRIKIRNVYFHKQYSTL